MAPSCETVRTNVFYIVYIGLGTLLHDRTTYGSNFARPDKLWFLHRVWLVDFDPQKGVKSAPCGQIMLPEPDIFSFTTHNTPYTYPYKIASCVGIIFDVCRSSEHVGRSALGAGALRRTQALDPMRNPSWRIRPAKTPLIKSGSPGLKVSVCRGCRIGQG